MAVLLDSAISVSPRNLLWVGTSEEEAIRKEYDDLVKQEAGVESALFDEARKFPDRNRYVNFLPNEPTRFKIAQEPAFYFNANWIFGKKAIACQGPKSNEIEEFWRMVWKSKAGSIVMLTNLVERVEKCTAYWPALDKVLKFKKMSITALKEEVLFENGEEHIVKRDFKIIKAGKHRMVSQFQLENWPDHGVVTPVTLAELVRQVVRQSKEPFVVHCSAGVGRTGTFLTAYFAFQQKTEVLSGVLKDLRDPSKGRVGLMQSSLQYLVAYQAVKMLNL